LLSLKIQSHGPAGGSPDVELQTLKDELTAARVKLSHFEHSWRQAKVACDAWRKEAEESKYLMQTTEQEKQNFLAKLQLVRYYTTTYVLYAVFLANLMSFVVGRRTSEALNLSEVLKSFGGFVRSLQTFPFRAGKFVCTY
jgi:hypothetical protein